MAIRVQNITDQTIPLVMPIKLGGNQINIGPRKTLVLAIDKPTDQINSLVSLKKLKIKK